MTTSEQKRGTLRAAAPEFPPGVDGRALLAPCFHSAWRHSGAAGREYRRVATRLDPLLFAVTYLGRHLRDQTTGLMSFAPHHLDMAATAIRWVRPEPTHDAIVLPRGGAKSTWMFLINPLWAMAHGHREFPLFVSYNGEQAEIQLSNLRAELAENELLLADFPELKPKRGSNTKRTVLTNGASFAARGLFSTSNGLRMSTNRPDLIIGDDLEPGPERHSPDMKQKIETALTSSIMPMGTRHTAVQLTGTTTMVGCLMHDVVRAARGESVAAWVAAHGFTPRYYPAILDEGTAAERSLWPQRWSLEWLRQLRGGDPQDYALNYANRPELSGAHGYWRPELIRYDPHQEITRRVLFVDPAMTDGPKSDLTAIVLAGLSRDGRTVVIEHAEAGNIPGLELRNRLWEITQRAPRTIREWVIESNQGCDRWRDIVTPLPVGVRLDTEHVGGSKRSRIEVALAHYQRRAVVHADVLTQLEEQMLAWTPRASRDDLLDALAGSLRRLFPKGVA